MVKGTEVDNLVIVFLVIGMEFSTLGDVALAGAALVIGLVKLAEACICLMILVMINWLKLLNLLQNSL